MLIGEIVVDDGNLVVRLMETPKPQLVGVPDGDERDKAGAGVIVTPPTVFPARILLLITNTVKRFKMHIDDESYFMHLKDRSQVN